MEKTLQDALNLSMGEGVSVTVPWTDGREREVLNFADEFEETDIGITARGLYDECGGYAPWCLFLKKGDEQ